MADVEMIDTTTGRHRGKSTGRNQMDGYGTDF